MTAFFTTLLLMVFLALPGIVAVRVSGYFFGESEWWRRAFAAACLWPLLIFGVSMLLAPFALLKVWPVLAAMSILAALSLAIPAVAWRADPADRRYFEPRNVHILALGAFLAVTGMGFFVFSNYATGLQLMSDDFAYHGPAIGAWYRTGTLDHPRIMFPSYYPFNGHIITLYTIFATGDLRWTWVATFFWLLLGCGALLHVTRCLPGGKLGWGLFSAAMFLVCSEVAFYHFYTLSPADVVGAVAFLSGFVVAFPRAGAPPREALARVFLSGALIGFAMGAKSTFALPGVVGGFGLLMIALLGPSPFAFAKRLWTTMGLLAVSAFLAGSYWYLWNWIHARNPVFPAKVLNFRGPGNDKSWGETKLTYFIENAGDSGIWWEIGKQSINYPHVLGMVGVIGLIVCAGFIGRQVGVAVRTREVSPLGHPLIWMFIAGLTLILQYPFLPYSGSFITNELIISQRYFLFFFLIGAISLCWALANLGVLIRDAQWRHIAEGTAAGALLLVIMEVLGHNRQTVGSTQTIPALVAGALVAVGIFSVGKMPRFSLLAIKRHAFAVVLIPALVLLPIAGMVREWILPPPYMKIIDIPATAPIPRIINAIDQLPDGSRIGKFSLNTWEYGYLCGSRFQHEPVILWEQGPALITLHEAYYARMIDEGYPRFGLPRQGYLPNPDTFSEKLRQVDLDYLLVTQYLMGVFDGIWPPQRAFIQRMPEFELVWSDENSEIYKRLPDTLVEAPASQ